MKVIERPLFLLTAAWILGVICGTAISESTTLGLLLVITTVIFITVIPSKNVELTTRIICLTILGAGIARTIAYKTMASDDISTFANGKNSYVYGTISSDPELLSDKTRFTIHAERINTYSGTYRCSGNATVTLYPPKNNNHANLQLTHPSYGDQVLIHGRLSLPHTASNPGQADYSKYLARKRIYSTISSDATSCIEISQRLDAIRTPAFMFKKLLNSKVDKLFGHAQGALLLGILLGNYSSLPYNVQSNFMRTGTMHLLAASGYNCGILIAIFGWFLRFFTAPRSSTHIILIVLIWIFVLIAGAGPSIIRAAIMITLILMAYLLKRVADFLNIILFAILSLLIYNPLFLYDVGFQLSFAAVLCIVLTMPLMERLLPQKPTDAGTMQSTYLWAIRWVGGVVLVSFASMLGTWPITAYYFNYLSLSAIACNALIAALVFPITASGILAITFGTSIPLVGDGLVLTANFFLDLMLKLVNIGGGYKWSAISVHSPNFIIILIYYILVACAIKYAGTKLGDDQQNAA